MEEKTEKKQNTEKKTAQNTKNSDSKVEKSKNQRRGRRIVKRQERARSEFDNKIISIRRVTRVVAGGRRFSFSVAIVIGNKKGSVGVGTGKASDTALAIEKATRSAKKQCSSYNKSTF